ncbi:MAG TPA: hypothetical protein VHA70_00980 [Bauldia sp.]|nr:hypothetical protein [Bauldia sp.]
MLFRWLISAIGFAALRDELRRAVRRTAVSLVALVLWCVALSFGLAALTVWLATVVGVIWALAIVAGAFALVAIIMQVSLAATARKRAPPAAPIAGLTASGVLPELGIGGALVGAALVAYLLARQLTRK